MKIVGLCISKRPETLPIALHAWFDQQLPFGDTATLLILCPAWRRSPYDDLVADVMRRRRQEPDVLVMNRHGGEDHVTREIAFAAEYAFARTNRVGLSADLCTMWDDDDWSPPDRLARTMEMAKAHPEAVLSYDRGYFVNLRTLFGHQVTCVTWPLWGGCLTWPAAVNALAGGWEHRKTPGYDRTFVQDAVAAGVPVATIPGGPGTLPVAFSHGDNVATMLRHPGVDMAELLQRWMSPSTFAAVCEAKQFLIRRRIFPAWS